MDTTVFYILDFERSDSEYIGLTIISFSFFGKQIFK
jgi:hypothetical protein